MIYGLGTDIIEVSRIKKAVEKESFKTKVFTSKEIEYCEVLNSAEQRFAARFAAKEAYLKALGTGWRDGIKWTDIEVCNNDLGKPELKFYGKALEINENLNISNVFVTLSHIKNVATATVILER